MSDNLERQIAVSMMTDRLVALVFAAINYGWLRVCAERLLMNPAHEEEVGKLAELGTTSLDLDKLCDAVVEELTDNLGEPAALPTCAEVVRAVEEHLRAQVEEKLK